MRAEVLAPRMMAAALEPLAHATGSEAAAVVDVIGDGIRPTLLHALGAVAASGAGRGADRCSPTAAPRHRPRPRPATGGALLACASADAVRRAGRAACCARPPGARPWDADDRALVAAAGALIRIILEHEAIQREMARQARTDPLTGLLNRRAFLDELARRIDRLEREELPGTLLFIDLDHFKALNDCCGHDAGDEALRRTAQLLRATHAADRPGRAAGRRRVRGLAGRCRRVRRRRAGRATARRRPRRRWRR